MDRNFGNQILLLIFLALPRFAFNIPICSAPYECLTPAPCAERLTSKATEQILFRCDDKNKLCCPPITAVSEHSSTGNAGKKNFMECLHPEKIDNNSSRPETHYNPVKVHCKSCGQVHTNVAPSPTAPTYIREVTTKGYASHRNFNLLPSSCGMVDIPDRITEGEEAELGEFPWMALVGVRDKNRNLKWLCGGTLISPRYVLTAAHCIREANGSVPIVRLGEHDLQNKTDCNMNDFCLNPPMDFNVEEVVVHSRWNSTTIKNDIALLRLPEVVIESYSVSPICLPIDLQPENSPEDVKYEVAGWGKTDWNALPGSRVLRKGTLSSVSNQDCNLCKGNPKERYCPISRTQICAQGWKSVDVCKGDSGGPLMLSLNKVYQLGITSFKSTEYCGADNIPSIFTRVESYVDWILDNMRE